MFTDAAGGAAQETLVLKAAFCVRYQEEFMAGDTTAGAYVCHLVLSDPDGFTMQAFVAIPTDLHYAAPPFARK